MRNVVKCQMNIAETPDVIEYEDKIRTSKGRQAWDALPRNMRGQSLLVGFIIEFQSPIPADI